MAEQNINKIPQHLNNQIYPSCLSKILHSTKMWQTVRTHWCITNVANCQNTLMYNQCGKLSEHTDV